MASPPSPSLSQVLLGSALPAAQERTTVRRLVSYVRAPSSRSLGGSLRPQRALGPWTGGARLASVGPHDDAARDGGVGLIQGWLNKNAMSLASPGPSSEGETRVGRGLVCALSVEVPCCPSSWILFRVGTRRRFGRRGGGLPHGGVSRILTNRAYNSYHGAKVVKRKILVKYVVDSQRTLP